MNNDKSHFPFFSSQKTFQNKKGHLNFLYGMIHIRDSPPPCPSKSKLLPPHWPWTSNFKRTTPKQTTAPCMWNNDIKTKTEPNHVTFKLTTHSIVWFIPHAIQWYHERMAWCLSQKEDFLSIIYCLAQQGLVMAQIQIS